MAKGYEANQERLRAIAALGKVLAKRARFKCEWCEGEEELRPSELAPEAEPDETNVALLCASCRALREARRPDPARLRALTGAVWHAEPLVAREAARLLAASGEDWARELVADSMLDEDVKAALLG